MPPTLGLADFVPSYVTACRQAHAYGSTSFFLSGYQ